MTPLNKYMHSQRVSDWGTVLMIQCFHWLGVAQFTVSHEMANIFLNQISSKHQLYCQYVTNSAHLYMILNRPFGGLFVYVSRWPFALSAPDLTPLTSALLDCSSVASSYTSVIPLCLLDSSKSSSSWKVKKDKGDMYLFVCLFSTKEHTDKLFSIQ